MKRRRTTWLGMLALLAVAPGMARDADPPDSLYHLDARLTSQAGQPQGLDLYRGHPVLVTMFYSSCQATCPLIIDTLRATERALDPAQRGKLRVLLISFDPERDTPAALREVAETRHIDTTRWTLAHADESTVRTIAALLNVQYRRLPSGEFSHSTLITLLSPDGAIKGTTATLGHADPALLAQLGEFTK
ncbi:MAG TPA: SCO family protein [Steroidobacteraceae bacterium]|nr:SCO family protein [Steroidobacteraceae bacterium]